MAEIRVFGKATRTGVKESAIFYNLLTKELVPPNEVYPSGSGVTWEAVWDDPPGGFLFVWRKRDGQIQSGTVILIADNGVRVVGTVDKEGILTYSTFLDLPSEAFGRPVLFSTIRRLKDLRGFCRAGVMFPHQSKVRLELPEEIEHFTKFEGFNWIK